MKLRIGLGFSAILALVMLWSCGDSGELHVSHVYAFKGAVYSQGEGDRELGGLSLISTALKDLREDHEDLRIIFGNNTIHGSPEAFFSSGEVVVELLNDLDIWALIPDPREFYFGVEQLQSLAAKASFPLVSANLKESDGSVPSYIRPWILDSRGTWALVGLSGPQLIERNLSENVEGLELVSSEEALSQAFGEIKGENIPRVLLSAPGWKLDGAQRDAQLERWYQLADTYGLGLQVVMGERESPNRGLFEYSRPDGSVVTYVAMDDDLSDKGQTIDLLSLGGSQGTEYKTIEVSSDQFEADGTLQRDLAQVMRTTNNLLDEVVAVVEGDLPHFSFEPSPYGSFISSLLVSGFSPPVDLFFMNSGNLRGGIQNGSLTVRALYETMPFDANLVSFTMDGASLYGLILESLDFVREKTTRGYGNFWNLTMEPEFWTLERVPSFSDMIIGDEVLDPNASYRVGTVRYIFEGGDGYTGFDPARDVVYSYSSVIHQVLASLRGRVIDASRWSFDPGQ